MTSVPNFTSLLCARCGLCCDGSLFADVELANNKEADTLESLGINVDHDDDVDGPLLLQPCTALRQRRCGIYPHRPNCCRTFECKLLQNVRRGTITVNDAKMLITDTLFKIRELKRLLRDAGKKNSPVSLKERYLEALAKEKTGSATRLQTTMESLENLIAKTFLGR